MSRTCKVFTDYKTHPPHPKSGWTRFVCISDTHSRRYPVPMGDVLLHSGDISSWGYPEQVEATLDWLQELEHPIKILIAGNHDLCLDASLSGQEQVLPLEDPTLQRIRERMRGSALRDANIHYLQHSSLKFSTREGKEWFVYGSPSAPRYARGAFQYESAEEAHKIYGKIPPETEILLTHTPPHNVLDLTVNQKNAGCRYLAERLPQLKMCRLHVFGHVHEAWGVQQALDVNHISVNAALPCSGSKAVIVDLKN